MPALKNPRYERFAQALFAGLAGETRIERAQSTAYLTAYPNCSNGNSAEAAASRLLRRVKPILERVRELQAEQAARTQRKIDVSRERIARDLDEAATLAKTQGNANAIVSAALGIAKIFGHETSSEHSATSFQSARTMQDVATRLLQAVGYREPSSAAIDEAMTANDAFVQTIEEIRAKHDTEFDDGG
jgi:thiamine kinase-like enzyme